MLILTPKTGRVSDFGGRKPYKTSLVKRIRKLEEAEGRLDETIVLLQQIRRGAAIDSDSWKDCKKLGTVLPLGQLAYRNLLAFLASDTCLRVEADFEGLRYIFCKNFFFIKTFFFQFNMSVKKISNRSTSAKCV